jgi:hypothetical protein
VQQVAQRICDNVKPGSSAVIAFVGKVPGPGPINISDWGKYRYDCTSAAPVRAPAPAPVRVAAPAAATAAPAAIAPPPAVAPAAAPAQAVVPSPVAPAMAPTDAQEQQRRECQRKQGAYQICTGSCLASSSSASGVVEAECAQRCASQLPAGCGN